MMSAKYCVEQMFFDQKTCNPSLISSVLQFMALSKKKNGKIVFSSHATRKSVKTDIFMVKLFSVNQ
jgi:hypothetical protein